MPIQHTLRLASISGGMTVSVIADAAICEHKNLAFIIWKSHRWTYWSDGGGLYIIFSPLTCKRLSEGDKSHLGGTVICLSKIACHP